MDTGIEIVELQDKHPAEIIDEILTCAEELDNKIIKPLYLRDNNQLSLLVNDHVVGYMIIDIHYVNQHIANTEIPFDRMKEGLVESALNERNSKG